MERKKNQGILESKRRRLQNRENSLIYRRMVLREKHKTVGLNDKETGELAALEKILDVPIGSVEVKSDRSDQRKIKDENGQQESDLETEKRKIKLENERTREVAKTQIKVLKERKKVYKAQKEALELAIKSQKKPEDDDPDIVAEKEQN